MPNGFGNIFAIPTVDTRGIAASVPKYNPMSGLAALIQAQNAVMRQARAAGGGGGALGPGQYKGVGDPSKGKWAKIPGIAELQWIPGSSKEERAANEAEAINQARAAIIQSDTDLQNQLRGLSEKSVPAQQEVLAAVRTNGTIARMAPKLGLSEDDTAKLLLDIPTQELAKRQKAIGEAGFFKQLKDMGAGIIDRFSASVEAFGKSAEEQAAIGRRSSQQEAQRISDNAFRDEEQRLEKEGRSTADLWLSRPFSMAVSKAGPIAATVVPQLALGTAGMMVGGPVGGLAGAVLGGGLSSAAYGAGEMLQRAVNDPNLTPEQQAQAAHEGYYTGAGISGVVGAIPIGPAAIPGAIGRRMAARSFTALPTSAFGVGEAGAKAAAKQFASTAEGKAAQKALTNEIYARQQLARSGFSRTTTSMLGTGVDAATLGVAEQLGHNLAYNSASGQNTPVTEGLFEQGLAGAVLGIPFGIRGGRARRWAAQVPPVNKHGYVASTYISPEQMAEGNWMPPVATDAELAAALGTSATKSVKPVTPKGAAKFNVSRASEIVNNTEARDLMPKVEAAIWRGDADAAAFEKVVRKLPEDDPKRLAVAKGIENAYIGRVPDITETPVPNREIPATSQEGGAAIRVPTTAEQALSTSTKDNVSKTVSNLYYSGTSLQGISEAARTIFRNKPDMRAEVEREIMRLTQNTPQYMPESGVKKMLGAAKKKAELQQALETELTRGNIDPTVLDNVMQGYSANSWRRQAMADALAVHRAAQTKEASRGNGTADAAGRVNEPTPPVAATEQLREGAVDTTNPPVDSTEPVNTEAAAPAAADQPLAEARVRNPNTEGRGDAGTTPQDTGAPEAVAAAPRGQESGGVPAVDGERGGGAAASKRATADTGKRSGEPEAGTSPRSSSDGTDAGGAAPVARGNATEIINNDNTTDAAHYEVRELDDLIPSHDPDNGFAKRPDYPKDVQERPYHSDRGEQDKVRINALQHNTDLVLTDNPAAENGPPIIAQDGVVLGGNSRVMTLQLVYGDAERGANYRGALMQRAAHFGINPDDVASMRRPVLVRAVEGRMTPAEMAVKSRKYNQGMTQKLQSKAEGVSRARLLSTETLNELSTDLAEFNTLREYFADPKSRRFVQSLQRDGVIDRTEASALIDKDGRLNARGKDLVEDALRGLVMPNYDILAHVPASILNKLDKAIPALAKLKARGEGWNITDVLMPALRHINAAQRNGQKLATWYDQVDMLNTDSDKGRPAVQVLARTLDGATQKEVLARFEAFAKAAERRQKGRGSLMDTPEAAKPEAAFIEAFMQPIASVGGKPVANFNPAKNARHAALAWAAKHGGESKTVAGAQSRLENIIRSSKASGAKEAEVEAKERLSALSGYSGAIAIYEPKLENFPYRKGAPLELTEPARELSPQAVENTVEMSDARGLPTTAEQVLETTPSQSRTRIINDPNGNLCG